MSQTDSLDPPLPEYVRFPKRGSREHYSNLSYSTLDRLVRPQECNDFKPPVTSRILRARGGKGANRGARLIHLPSLLAYIGQLLEEAKHALGDARRARPK